MNSLGKIIVGSFFVAAFGVFVGGSTIMQPYYQHVYQKPGDINSGQMRVIRAYNSIASVMNEQAPMLTEVQNDYQRNNPLLVIVPEDVRNSQRTRRVAQWREFVAGQKLLVKYGEEAISAENDY